MRSDKDEQVDELFAEHTPNPSKNDSSCVIVESGLQL